MSQTRIPSPARSQGAPVTPRRLQTRGTRSVGSPARSTASGRLSSIIQFKVNNKDSFFLSPLPARRSVLNDDTEIEEPRRRSWWKKLSENSQDAMEALNENKILETNKAIEEYIDIEVLSQEKKNYTFDLPESSDNESICSIVIPTRKIFMQKENQPQKKFAQLEGSRDTLAKLHRTVQQDITVHVAPRNLFNQASKPKSKLLYPAALLNISSNKTVDKTKENAVAEVKGKVRTLFGNRPATKRKNMFADFIVSESEDEISEIQPKVFGFQKRDEPLQCPSTAHNKRDASPSSSVTTDIEMEDWRLLPSSTMVENQLEEMIVKTPVKRARLSKLPNIVESETTLTTNNSMNKTRQSYKSTTKNKSKYFPEHIQDNENQSLKSLTQNRSKLLLEQAEAEKDRQEAMEEDLAVVYTEEVNDGLPSVDNDMRQTSFSHKIQTPNLSHNTTGRSRKNDQSKVDPPKVVLLNKSKQMNSSTVVEKQLEDMMAAVSTPAKQARGSKLLDIKESATIQNNNTSINKTRQSNKSITSPEDNEDNESQTHKSLTRSKSKLLLEQTDDENEHQKGNKEVEEEGPEVASTGESEAANEVLRYEDDDIVQNDQIDNESGQTSSINQSGAPNVSHNITDQHRKNESKKEDQSKVNSPEVVLYVKTKQMESYTIVEKEMEIMMGDVNTPVNEARLSKLSNSNKSGTIHTSIINTSINKTRQSNFSTKNNSLNSLDQIENNMNQSLTSLTRNRSKLLSKQMETEEDQDLQEDGQEVEEEKQELDVDDQEEEVVSQEVEKKDQEIDEEGDEVEVDGQESDDGRQDIEDVEEEIEEVGEDDQEVEVSQEMEEESQEMDEDDQEEAEISQEGEIEGQEVDEHDQEEADVSKEVEEESQKTDDDDQEEAEVSQEVEDESQEVDEHDQEEADVSKEVEEESQKMDEDDQEEAEVSQEVEDESQEVDEHDQEEADVSKEVEEESQEVDEDDQEEAEVSQEVEGQEADEESDGVEVDVQESEDENQEVDEQSQEIEDDKAEDKSTEEIKATNEDEDSEQNEQIGETSIQPSFNNENGTPNVSHDTTGRHRKKEQSKVNSPEIILHDKTKQMESFVAKGRNTSLRRTSIMKSMSIRPSLAPHRDSTGISDGTKNSSAEGSGWDSHRTTRKTLRQTFGKDFSPRKSLRALVMEKSAKRQTAINDVTSVTSKFPQANSTELPEGSMVQEYDEVAPESDHEVSKRTRQTTLEMYLQKIKKQNMEKKMQMEEIVRNSLKAPPKDTFKVPARPMFAARKSNTKAQSKPKAKQKSNLVLLDDLPADVLEDMKYKPPKRFQPSNAAWITKRLYKFLETKLEPKYDYKARLRAEKLVANVYQFCRELRRCDAASPAAVQALKVDMARLNVVTTHFEFYQFFEDYMPREVRIKVVPDVVNKIPLPKHGVFSDILRENAAHD